MTQVAPDALQSLLATVGSGATPWKQSCRVFADANLSLAGTQTIDGVALQVGDPVLAGGQTNARDNGPYIVASGAWSRRSDWSQSQYVHLQSMFPIAEGTAHGGNVVKLTSPTNGTVQLGFTPLVFADVGPIGAYTVFTPGQASVASSPTPIDLDFDGVTDIDIAVLTTGITVNAPTNIIDGVSYTVTSTQSSGGFDKIEWDAAYVFPDGLGLPCLAGDSSTTWLFRAVGGELHCLLRTFSIGYVEFATGSPALVPGIVNILSGTVVDPILPDAADWAGMSNAVTVKLANLTGGCDVQPSGSETLNGAGSFSIASDYGDAVFMSLGTSDILASPG